MIKNLYTLTSNRFKYYISVTMALFFFAITGPSMALAECSNCSSEHVACLAEALDNHVNHCVLGEIQWDCVFSLPDQCWTPVPEMGRAAAGEKAKISKADPFEVSCEDHYDNCLDDFCNSLGDQLAECSNKYDDCLAGCEGPVCSDIYIPGFVATEEWCEECANANGDSHDLVAYWECHDAGIME